MDVSWIVDVGGSPVLATPRSEDDEDGCSSGVDSGNDRENLGPLQARRAAVCERTDDLRGEYRHGVADGVYQAHQRPGVGRRQVHRVSGDVRHRKTYHSD